VKNVGASLAVPGQDSERALNSLAGAARVNGRLDARSAMKNVLAAILNDWRRIW